MKMTLFCAITALISCIWLVFCDMSHTYKVIFYIIFCLNLFISGFNVDNEIKLKELKKNKQI